MNVRIIGTGSYVPERVVTNEDLAAMVDTSDEWIRTRTGICQRRISEGIGVSGMAAEAARKAIENAGVQAEEIDLILLGTSTPDSCFPKWGPARFRRQSGPNRRQPMMSVRPAQVFYLL